MDRVKKAKPVWDEYFDRWILSQQISTYGDHHLDYACSYKTLKTIGKEENCLFIKDKEPVYETMLKWKDVPKFWVLREYKVSCGSIAVIGHEDLKIIEKMESGLFISCKEEIV